MVHVTLVKNVAIGRMLTV